MFANIVGQVAGLVAGQRLITFCLLETEPGPIDRLVAKLAPTMPGKAFALWKHKVRENYS